MTPIKKLCEESALKVNGSVGFIFSAKGSKKVRRTEKFSPGTVETGDVGVLVKLYGENGSSLYALQIKETLQLVVSAEDDFFSGMKERK